MFKPVLELLKILANSQLFLKWFNVIGQQYKTNNYRNIQINITSLIDNLHKPIVAIQLLIATINEQSALRLASWVIPHVISTSMYLLLALPRSSQMYIDSKLNP